MADLTREAILAANVMATEKVPVPEWGGTVTVRGMTGDELEAFLRTQSRDVPAGNRAGRRGGQTEKQVSEEFLRARMVAWCVVDDDGNRKFSDDDVAALNKTSSSALVRIARVVMRLSGLDEDELDRMAEEMVENPFTNGSSSSPSASAKRRGNS